MRDGYQKKSRTHNPRLRPLHVLRLSFFKSEVEVNYNLIILSSLLIKEVVSVGFIYYLGIYKAISLQKVKLIKIRINYSCFPS